MRLHFANYLLLASVALIATSIDRANASLSRHSFSVGKNVPFGLPSRRLIGTVPRGGSQDEASEEEAEVQEVLYLPGLLETSIEKNAQVNPD